MTVLRIYYYYFRMSLIVLTVFRRKIYKVSLLTVVLGFQKNVLSRCKQQSSGFTT